MKTPWLVPVDSGHADEDIYVLKWRNGRKSLIVSLTEYGHFSISIGLCEPAGGSKHVDLFEDAWKWLCNSEETLFLCKICQDLKQVSIGPLEEMNSAPCICTMKNE